MFIKTCFFCIIFMETQHIDFRFSGHIRKFIAFSDLPVL